MDTNPNMQDFPSTQNQRRFPRLEFREPVAFQTKDASNFGGCLPLDLSEGGMRINFEEFLPVGTQLNVQVKLDSRTIVDLAGRVAWVAHTPHSDWYQMGLEFVEPGPVEDAREKLRTFFQSRRF